MPRFVFTGPPGGGKTTLLTALAAHGYPVVPEAATDVIAEMRETGHVRPWEEPDFTDRILARQRQRERAAGPDPDTAILFDRAPMCTVALSAYLGRAVTVALAEEMDRVRRDQVYHRDVFFVRAIGFVEPTDARRISYAESLVFERVHEETYTSLGYRLIHVPAGPIEDRVALIERHLADRGAAPRSPAGD
jgi:predicted ATPase